FDTGDQILIRKRKRIIAARRISRNCRAERHLRGPFLKPGRFLIRRRRNDPGANYAVAGQHPERKREDNADENPFEHGASSCPALTAMKIGSQQSVWNQVLVLAGSRVTETIPVQTFGFESQALAHRSRDLVVLANLDGYP